MLLSGYCVWKECRLSRATARAPPSSSPAKTCARGGGWGAAHAALVGQRQLAGRGWAAGVLRPLQTRGSAVGVAGHLVGALLEDQVPRQAQGVLADCDDLLIEQQLQGGRRDALQVGRDK